MRVLNIAIMCLWKIKIKALSAAVLGNLFMGIWGIVLWIISKESLISIDGIFSTISALSATALLIVTIKGIEGDQKEIVNLWYSIGRTSFIISFLIYRLAESGYNIWKYHNVGISIPGEIPFLKTYMFAMAGVCFLLSFFMKFIYTRTGKEDNVFRLESRSSFVDGVISILAGGILIWFERTTFVDGWFWFNFIGLDAILIGIIPLLIPEFAIELYKSTRKILGKRKSHV